MLHCAMTGRNTMELETRLTTQRWLKQSYEVMHGSIISLFFSAWMTDGNELTGTHRYDMSLDLRLSCP